MSCTRPLSASRRRWGTVTGSAALILSLGLTGCTANKGATIDEADPSTYADGVILKPSESSSADRGKDIAFASGMIRNHQQAVEYSRILLDKEDVDEDARRVAQDIVDHHPGVVDELTGMLEDWGVESTEEAEQSAEATPSASAGPGAAAAGPSADEEAMAAAQDAAEDRRSGLLTSEERQALETAEGEDAGRIYLLQMQRLHYGAVMIAGTEVDEGEDDEAKTRAKQLRDKYKQDIEDMQSQLGDDKVVSGGSFDKDVPENAPKSIDNTDENWQRKLNQRLDGNDQVGQTDGDDSPDDGDKPEDADSAETRGENGDDGGQSDSSSSPDSEQSPATPSPSGDSAAPSPSR